MGVKLVGCCENKDTDKRICLKLEREGSGYMVVRAYNADTNTPLTAGNLIRFVVGLDGRIELALYAGIDSIAAHITRTSDIFKLDSEGRLIPGRV